MQKYIRTLGIRNNLRCCFIKGMNQQNRFRKNIFILLGMAIFLFFLSSCKTTTFYQFYKVSSINEFSKGTNSLVFEDDNCKVLYDFWGQGGEVGFMFYNKTDENIYVNMKESFFINNGIAHDYYQNRQFTNSKTFSSSISYSNTSMYSYADLNAFGLNASKSVSGYNYQGFKQTNTISLGITSILSAAVGISTTETKKVSTSHGSYTSYTENDIVCVPPNTTKVITEYCVTKTLYRDCDLRRYPSRSQIRTVKFTNSKSPFIFSNKIAYTVGKSEKLLSLENKFYVSEITNYPKESVIIMRYDEFCGDKSNVKNEFFNNYSPDNFFIKYFKEKSKFKH